MPTVDATDARILLALAADARLSGVELAQRLGLSRNTVQARLARLEAGGILGSVDRRVSHRALGYPLTAFVSAQVEQSHLAEIEEALAGIDEVVELHGVTGASDLVIRVVAHDTDDLYRIAGVILATPGVRRTEIALSMREMVPFRTAPLLRRRAGTGR
ncbi:AsnC family transcriptional regulator [Subtercola boreus]|uniref:AsnC family transcriptional regulator n=1 Tax=Subtercola boreus TaxID=120213 RepID=A0A3E0VMN3_9MICO|nr:Lrp/AsnC family transcriptional regulator [Subtercola boreus]RFA10683.1 AsnC family transcriptional regulator [Subtercola boreus]